MFAESDMTIWVMFVTLEAIEKSLVKLKKYGLLGKP